MRRGLLAATVAALALLVSTSANAADAPDGRDGLDSAGRFCTFDTCRPRQANPAFGAGSFAACILGAGWLARRQTRRSR